MPDGRIEPRQAERLREVGQWLERHGEAVYGTRGGPFRPGGWGAATCRGNVAYLHILSWPGDSLALPPLEAHVVASRVLTGGQASVVQSVDGITISVPQNVRDDHDTIVALELDRCIEPASSQ